MISIDNNSASARGTLSRRTVVLASLGMLLTAVVWGLSFVSTKVLSEKPIGLSPVQIYLIRFIMAYAVILCVCHKKLFSYSWRDELLFVLLGLSGGSIYFVTENIAVTLTAVANVSLITTLSPLITIFLVGILYRSERPSRWIVMGSVVALMGVALVVFGGDANAQIHPAGDLLALGAAVSFAIYSILIKKVNAIYTTWFITRKTFFYGIITAIPFLFMEPASSHAPLSVILRPEAILNLAFLGLVCSLTAYLMMARAIKVIGPVKANNYLYAQPIVTMLAGWIVLHEKVTWTGWLDSALIIGSLWLGETLNRKFSRK
ncbi:MAG: DMT family transporter [Muribaculaceae bacterium]|nr:DMT family transporter [Muribaculaceae bacterium]